jgi:ubiquinone/menaquinone biosynthesis C-methylase UbiE
MFGKISGSSSRLNSVDHNETYGRYLLESIIKDRKIETGVDLGCGGGDDLAIIRKYNPKAELFGIDFNLQNRNKLKNLNINPFVINIEKDKLPFTDEAIDFIIANQVLEHTKEIFWINHEVFRCLKKGGIFFLGVPNVLSFHNRLLMLCGYHPTCCKNISAHVRIFSKKDVNLFYKSIGNNFCKIDKVYGSQFYPFPKKVARFLSKVFPSLAVANFYVIIKTDDYNGEFLKWPKKNSLESNYFLGLN